MSVQNLTENTSSNRIWIGNLHPSVTEGDLIRLCQQHGKVRSVNYVWNKKFGPESGQPKGYSFVEMETCDSAKSVIQNSHGKLFKGRRLAVRYSQGNQLSSTTPSYDISKTKRKANDDVSSGNNDSISSKKPNIRDIDDKIRRIQDALPESK